MRLLIIAFLALFLIAGCASYPRGQLLPYSPALKNHYQLADDEVLRLQYYLSRDLELERIDSTRQHSVTEGRLVSAREQQIDRIVIRRGTPGVAIAAQQGRLQVSFAEGSQLPFMPAGVDSRSPYRLATQTSASGQAHVYIFDQAYRVVSDAPLPYLAINREVLDSAHSVVRQLDGRTLDQP